MGSEYKDLAIAVTVPSDRLDEVASEERELEKRLAKNPAERRQWSYWWSLPQMPADDKRPRIRRIYFAWQGAIRAWHEVLGFEYGPGGKPRVQMTTTIHKVSPPVPMKGFRGFRYVDPSEIGDRHDD